ncbi:Crp/Fnr family transcriptional regulator [Rhodoferax sp.]|uniref:Crp/Fnr family transcriptional regulator n=1 Tax=Rhodoferax sp. TaxID=50421 RepID=UPI00283B405D|nr:Crp/Fnr family transcriptional regulator [Rhodoferax sp.]MDR3367655.1 Crp/Fnr family transcriptional regulator [Rhodoferax sp.]
MSADAIQELHELLPRGLIASCEEAALPKGACLFKVGDRPQHMFFVVSGEVVLERPGLQGTSVILQRTRKGFVSEASLKSAKYHCHGQVAVNAKIIQIPVREIRDALDNDTAFAGRWIGMLNKEVKRLRLQCERLSLTKVQDRFVHLLETEGDDGRFPIGAGIKSLAAELGVTHEALYRCIYAMEKLGALTRNTTHMCLAKATDQKAP